MIRTVLYILGIFLTAIGILGFFNDPVLGIFDVDLGHNLVHLITGVLTILFATQNLRNMMMFGRVMAIVYGLVAILGLLMPNTRLFGFMIVNDADNVLHILLTLAYLYVGFAPNVDKPARNM